MKSFALSAEYLVTGGARQHKNLLNQIDSTSLDVVLDLTCVDRKLVSLVIIFKNGNLNGALCRSLTMVGLQRHPCKRICLTYEGFLD